jgi:hypothetical protein
MVPTGAADMDRFLRFFDLLGAARPAVVNNGAYLTVYYRSNMRGETVHAYGVSSGFVCWLQHDGDPFGESVL